MASLSQAVKGNGSRLIGLWATAQPPILVLLQLYASFSLTPSQIRFFRFRSGFFQFFQIQYLSRLRTQPSKAVSLIHILQNGKYCSQPR